MPGQMKKEVKMKKYTMAFFCLFLSLFTSSLYAAEITVFGPMQYLRANGSTTAYNDTFEATAGQAKLIVENGEWDGENRVDNQLSSARIIFNGTEIFSPNNFNKNVHLLEASINLDENNTILAELNGKPNGYLTISIVSDIPLPTVSFSASPDTISIGDSSTLAWSSENAESCEIAPDIGDVLPNGSLQVSPLQTTTYTITATGPGGSNSAPITVTVEVPQPEPTVNINASPETIDPEGEIASSLLTWSATDAETCIIVPEIGEGEVGGCEGQFEVSPFETTTYTITATGAGGTATASVTVTVESAPPVPIVIISASPEVVDPEGEVASSILTWSSTNAESCFIEPEIGNVSLNSDEGEGGIEVYPTETTTYSISATGPGGTTTDSVTVIVGNSNPAPTVNISASLEVIDPESGVTNTLLMWSATNSEVCTFAPEIGGGEIESCEGQFEVSPTETTTYTITAIGPGGSATDSVTVTVGGLLLEPTVTLSASPEIVVLQGGEEGSSTNLTWSSTNANNCTIEPGIGNVALYSGEAGLNIFPDETTTYTITAIGPGGTATSSVTVVVIDPSQIPTAEISVLPEVIVEGESSVISWNSLNADQCSIDNGIGAVPLSSTDGGIEVSPTETTTYSITASGPGGTSTESITLTVIPFLNATISASPLNILSGQTTTLTWHTTNAGSVTIYNGIGHVAADGTLPVNPDQTTTYTITASGPEGTISDSVTIKVFTHHAVNITYPLDNEFLVRPNTIVKGTIYSTSDDDVGLVVNGVATLINGNEFAANHVPLQDGENTITATATDPDGDTDSSSISVLADTTEKYVKLSAYLESGLVPLQTRLDVSGSFTITDPVISYSGPGTVEITPIPETNEFDITINDEGLYYFTVEAEDDQSNLYKDTIAINVVNKVALDALLKAKWNDMKTALSDGNIEGGLSYFLENSKPRYREGFNAIHEKMPEIINNMQDIEMIYAKEGIAKYRISREHAIEGNPVIITYYIYFMVDDKGVWKIDQF